LLIPGWAGFHLDKPYFGSLAVPVCEGANHKGQAEEEEEEEDTTADDDDDKQKKTTAMVRVARLDQVMLSGILLIKGARDEDMY
jgi:hypothetical protein